MTTEGHIWFRSGWYRSISLPHAQSKFLKRCHRLGVTGTRALQMGLKFHRIEDGGLEAVRYVPYEFKDGEVIELPYVCNPY